MKKLLLVFTLVFGMFAQAQKGTHEVSIDVADGIIMRSLELGYEYYVLDQTSAGLSMFFNFAKYSSDFKYNEKTMFTPYARQYFTDSRKWNYFGELWFGINSGYEEYADYTDMALGAAMGLKYVSNGGVTFSALGGIGRNLFKEESRTIVPRAGLSVGYQF